MKLISRFFVSNNNYNIVHIILNIRSPKMIRMNYNPSCPFSFVHGKMVHFYAKREKKKIEEPFGRAEGTGGETHFREFG